MERFDYLYAVFYLILLFLTYKTWGRKDRKSAWLAIILSFVFIGFRAPVVGADTWNYVRYLTGERYFYNYDPRPLEPLFVYYREIVCSLTSSRFVVMLLNTFLTMTPVLFLIKKYSYNVPLSLLLFFYLGCTLVYFVGLRQILGLSFVLWALLYIQSRIEKCPLKDTQNHTIRFLCYGIVFVFSIITGYYFHTSVVICGAIFIFSFIIPLRSRTIMIVLIFSTAVIGIILEQFNVLSFLHYLSLYDIDGLERISHNFEREDLRENSALLSLLRLSITGVLSAFFMDKDKINHVYTKIFIFGILIYNLFYAVPMSIRLVPIFTVFGCVVFTWIFGLSYNYNRNKRVFTTICSFAFVLYLTYSNFRSLYTWDPDNDSRMHPYYFVFQDYQDHPSIKRFK